MQLMTRNEEFMNKEDIKLSLLSGKSLYKTLLQFNVNDDVGDLYYKDAYLFDHRNDDLMYRDVIYIPSFDVAEIRLYETLLERWEIEEILSMCYTWDDFLEIAHSNEKLAECIFWQCNWQSPSLELDSLMECTNDEEAKADWGMTWEEMGYE